MTARVDRPTARTRGVAHPTRRILTTRLVDQARGLPARRPVIAAVAGFRGELGPETADAVRWAAYEASARKVALQIVSVVDWRSVPTWSRRADNLVVADLQRSADQTVEAAVAMARDTHPTMPVGGAVLRGSPLSILRTLGSAAGVVVTGTRQLPWLGEVLLGSFSAVLAAGAPCPVVVVSEFATPPGDVVVGVDEDNEPALRFAVEHARRHGLNVHAIYAQAPMFADEIVFRQDAERWVNEAVAGVRTDYPEVSIRASVHVHRTIETLLREAQGQRLLVVGRRRKTRYPGVQVGSVSQAVLHHARCPVAVVPI
jgi:nucleotide-binding universal stress UspA family protein